MKKLIWFLGALLLVIIISPRLLWKIEVIDGGKNLENNNPLIKDDVSLWALNGRAFFIVKATAQCSNPQNKFNIQGYLYSKTDVYVLNSGDISCSHSPFTVSINPQSPLPKFETFEKMKIISTENINDYKITWHNAHS